MRIALVGDVAFFGRNTVAVDSRFRERFAPVAKYLEQFDYVIGNLEAPFGRHIDVGGARSAYLQAAPENVELLKFLHVNVVNLANNHIYDYGRAGCRGTIDLLDANGIGWFGVDGRQLDLVSSTGKVALHGYCSHNTNPLGIATAGRAGVNALNVALVERKMTANHERGFLNIVSVHSGQEHVNYPSRQDIQMARRFARIAPYIYYGHHPHVIQGIESCRGSILAYSLGNFVFDDVYTPKSDKPLIRQTQNNKEGLLVELKVSGAGIAAFGTTPVIVAGDAEAVVGNDGVGRRIAEYSSALSEPAEEYERHRSALIRAFLSERKRARDLTWYLKRLRWSSLGIIVRAKFNQVQYRRNVGQYLSE